MRRYWHPIAPISDLDKDPVLPVRLLGEDLTLYRDSSGKLGLIGDRCAHRAISLAYGIPQENGLRCAYHGWTYNEKGQVIDMPFEPACLPLKIPSYTVQELADTVWAYLGPEPAPLLPRWDILVREGIRSIRITELACNWLQCMDNSLDPVHFEHLHGTYGNYMMKKLGLPPMMKNARHVKIAFDPWIYGIYKRRLTEGQSETAGDWTIGHPIIFPQILAQGDSLQYRVPIDDTHTSHFTFWSLAPKQGEASDPTWLVEHAHIAYDEQGRVLGDYVIRQDEMAWIGQGAISDRSAEHLVTSDKGIMLFRRLLLDNIERVAANEDPIGVIRDPAVNFPMIEIERGSTYETFRNGIPLENRGGARANHPVRA
jgi:5,5'-dehydrodivanillate O-demethylase